MTAVDVDALAKLREAALTIRKEYPSFPVLEQQDDTDVIAVWSDGASCPVAEECDEDMAALIVATVNSLPDLLAEVRRGRALRERLLALHKQSTALFMTDRCDLDNEPWPCRTAVLAAVDGGE